MVKGGGGGGGNWTSVNPLHPNISICILPTVLQTFAQVLRRRICLKIKILFSLMIISFILMTLYMILWWYCKEKLDACHSWGQRVIYLETEVLS